MLWASEQGVKWEIRLASPFFGSSSISGAGIDLCWERWICFLLLGGTTSVSSGTDA
jgi:hypothetical protein